MKKEVIVVVLAGGVGKRFQPFVTDKSVFPIFGEPLLVHNLRKLVAVGFSRFVIVTNETNDAAIRALSNPSIRIETVIQKNSSGMGDAILAAKDVIRNSPILVVNAEDVLEDSLYEQVKNEMKKGESFVTGKKTHEYVDSGYLHVSGKRVVGIVEKPGKGNEPSNLINLVFHYFPLADGFIEYIGRVATTKDDVYEQALNSYMKDHEVSFVSYEGTWLPFKYPWHVLGVSDYFLHNHLKVGRGKHIDIRNNVSIEGPVFIGNNVRIFENTKIVGPVYIGDNTIIGNNNIIRESFIGNDCVTGFNTDITRSYIGNDCWFHSNYLGDSVLEGNVSLGSGSVLANLRLDEGEISSYVSGARMGTKRSKLGALIAQDVRIGVNASIMPGVKIGTNSFVGAGVILDRDIPEDSFCVSKSAYEVKKNNTTIPSNNRQHFKAKI